MAYDKHGHPIVDGKPLNQEQVADEDYNRGLMLDGKGVEARDRALIESAKQRRAKKAATPDA
jgi:hypothetical protein